MKVWSISLCFMDAEIIHDSIEQYYKTKHPEVETNHILVDQHWPINYSKQKRALELIAKKFGCQLLDPGKNLGLHEGFNWAWRQQAIPDNAMVIGYDPDSWPLDDGWDMAMAKAFVGSERIEWLSLWHTHCERQVFERRFRRNSLCTIRRKINSAASPRDELNLWISPIVALQSGRTLGREPVLWWARMWDVG
jgi:hypothetical protein